MKKFLPFILILLCIRMPSIGQRTCGTIYNQEYINSLLSDTKEKLKKFNQRPQDKDENSVAFS
jgi:hypothetical protein